jgi:hypothetical protein
MKHATPLLLLVPSLLGCGVDDACPRGERGCNCTLQSSCEAGLECQANVCVRVFEPPAALNAVAPAGGACATDAHCQPGLHCIQAEGGEFLGAGPAGGYCSAACTGDAQCQAVDAQAVCDAALGLCLRRCFTGDPQPSENKCLERATLACVRPRELDAASQPTPEAVLAGRVGGAGTEREQGVCRPVCASDADCGTGRSCNAATGLCSAAPATGKAVNQPCQTDAECAGGLCLFGACSAACVARRNDQGCGFGPGASRREAACLFPFTNAFGDLGICFQLCDTQADCTAPDFACLPNATALLNTGRSAACLPP